ncbi:substrate-binding domain-containing protein [Rhodococcus globerulus]|uniref:Substrate-binding domain-containing protein n=1 Tax=Rhodococcus globerulus TaxID=33008 RepID=A0ABU4C342_RHOGO|nr:substrate-binding domain-containing protein [Rhodococcus globerulus]MDV6270798.1 substrate-binding domain-containing protein [Rhodococcus globerulus]
MTLSSKRASSAKRTLPYFSFVLVCSAVIAGCSTGGPSSNGADLGSATETYKVAFVTGGVNLLGYQSMRCAAEAEAKNLNLSLSWQGTPSVEASEEMKILDGAVARNPDAIALVPWDSTAFVAPIRSLMNGGTPVITVDGSLADKVDTANVRTDNLEAGRAAARALADQLDGRGAVGILTAAPGNQVQNLRWQGFKDVLESEFPSITALPVQYVGADNAKATSVASSMLAGNPDLAAFYSTESAGSNGAAAAIRSLGRADVLNIGWDSTPETIELLKSGEIDGLVAQNFPEEGRLMIQTVNTALREPDKEIPYDIYPPVEYLTRDNVDDPKLRDFIYTPQC